MAEFDGERARLYGQALHDHPKARQGDIELMKKHLAPKPGEVILEVGAGNGMFSGAMADALLPGGKLVVTDPSKEQLYGVSDLKRDNIEIRTEGADTLTLSAEMFDAVWSFGAMHHVFNKTASFKNLHTVLKPGGRVILGDVFSGTTLAKHFDDRVAKYCVTGHEVAFWSKEYAESLCYLTGFEKPDFYDFNASWVFESKDEVGEFLYKLHAMTKTTPQECLEGAEEILGITKEEDAFYLNWEMTMILTRKI